MRMIRIRAVCGSSHSRTGNPQTPLIRRPLFSMRINENLSAIEPHKFRIAGWRPNRRFICQTLSRKLLSYTADRLPMQFISFCRVLSLVFESDKTSPIKFCFYHAPVFSCCFVSDSGLEERSALSALNETKKLDPISRRARVS